MKSTNHLTELACKKVSTPGKKLSDGHGMYLLVHKNGSKYWRLDYRLNGNPKDQGSTLVADSELKSAISHYLKLKDEEKQIHEKKKDLEVLIKQEVKQHAQVLDKKGRQLLSWKHHDHSRFDRSAFKQDHDALYQQYSKITSRRVLRVG